MSTVTTCKSNTCSDIENSCDECRPRLIQQTGDISKSVRAARWYFYGTFIVFFLALGTTWYLRHTTAYLTTMTRCYTYIDTGDWAEIGKDEDCLADKYISKRYDEQVEALG